MTATFRISEDDYLAAMKLHARLTPARLALTVGIGLLLVLGAAFGPSLVEAASVGGLVGGGGVLLATRFIVLPLMARRHYRKYKAIHEEFNAELLDHGLRLTVPHSDHTIVWQNVLKWRHDDRFVLLYPMPRLFHVVPKSVAARGFDLKGLLERLNRHVGPPA
ncbi:MULTISPECIES: YcxB family protein [unclassified Variovorax]|uniref:YcxB family protein n=1 Tax=unclassified Variovorax TaxID=663243 RepID=UPI0008D71E23|nr:MULTISPECIES: YcxB family protein [unclassified Variovorax]SEJ70858.1 YcxB-like protein [Variovorax sp. OK202]SFC81002.1 YcxB-like protein [Variovorax sp. OK212]